MASIQLKTTAPASVTTPPSGSTALFANSSDSDKPYYKDSGGTSHTLQGVAGSNGAGYTATSTTSLATAGSGSKSFTTQSGLAYTVGARIRATSAGTSEWMEGVVTSYSSTTLVATMDSNSGTGTHADWNINLAGEKGATGATGASGSALPGICQFRLTLETGVPVSTSDQTGKSTLYATPVNGNTVVLYNGSTWAGLTSAEVSLALSGLTSGKNYDVFLYNNSGTLTIELSAAWSSDTARTDALALQDGVYVKSGATTRLWVGTIRTTGTTTTEDSAAKRFVWSRYNQARRFMLNATETTDSWTYTTATFRQANANTANQLDYVTGDAATMVEAEVVALVNNSANANVTAGIGVDSTSSNSAQRYGRNSEADASTITQLIGTYKGYPGLGRHFLAWLERSSAAGTTTWYGDAGAATAFQTGISGTIWN